MKRQPRTTPPPQPRRLSRMPPQPRRLNRAPPSEAAQTAADMLRVRQPSPDVLPAPVAEGVRRPTPWHNPLRHERALRRRRRRIALAVLAVAVLLVAFLPMFRLQKVEWPQDLRQLDPQAMERAAGLTPGRHLLAGLGGSVGNWFSLRYGKAEQTLLDKFPAIRKIRLSMHLPGQIVGELEERVEVAYIAIPDGCVMVDKEFYALRNWSRIPTGIPLIEGITIRSVTLGRPLVVTEDGALQDVVSIMGAIIDADQDTRAATRMLPLVRSIRRIGSRQLVLYLVLPHSGAELTVTAETGALLAERMTWLRYAIDQGQLNVGKGVLHLTAADRPRFTPDR